MTKEQEKEFFIFWIQRWDTNQIKLAYESLLDKGHVDISGFFIQILSEKNEHLTFDECLKYAVKHYALDKKDICIAYLKQALSVEPTHIETNFRLAQCYIELEEFQKLNTLVLHMESFIKGHHHVLFLKGLCVLKLIKNVPVTRDLWNIACMGGSELACEGLKELEYIEISQDLERRELYQRMAQERNQALNIQTGQYNSQDFMKDLGGTAIRVAMFSVVGGIISSMFRGGGSA